MPYISDETGELMTNPDMDELVQNIVDRIQDLLDGSDDDVDEKMIDLQVDTWMPEELPPPELQMAQMETFAYWVLIQKVKAQLDIFFTEHATPKCPSCGGDLYKSPQSILDTDPASRPQYLWRHPQLSDCIGAKPA